MIKGYCDPKFQKVYDAFSNAITSDFETGAALAIEHQGKVITNLWGGYQDFNKTKEWEEDTLVNVFSVTKGVTATCISRLIDQGKLDPNKSVGDYWPEYSCNGKKIPRSVICYATGLQCLDSKMVFLLVHSKTGISLPSLSKCKPPSENLVYLRDIMH